MGISIGALPLSRLVFARGLHLRDDFDALAPWWTADVGTVAVSGGALQGATMADVGLNLVSNGEFTTNTTGWTANNAVLSRVDSETDPGANSGGTDKWALKVVDAGASAWASQILPIVNGATYGFSCRAYAPSANTAVNAAVINAGAINVQVTAEDTWQSLSGQVTLTLANTLVLNVPGFDGDIGYFDKVDFYRQNTVLTAQCKANGTVQAGVAMPAAGVVPRSVILRRSDSLNYWEARMLPNTAATDLQLYEVNAGAHQLRASADIDWTADATDEVQVSLRGATIEVYHRKAGAGVWTLGCSYASATHNQTATRHGGSLWETGVNAFTYWEYRS